MLKITRIWLKPKKTLQFQFFCRGSYKLHIAKHLKQTVNGLFAVICFSVKCGLNPIVIMSAKKSLPLLRMRTIELKHPSCVIFLIWVCSFPSSLLNTLETRSYLLLTQTLLNLMEVKQLITDS